MAKPAHYDAATRRIDEEAVSLNELSQSIWSNPEINYQEKHAHETLCNFLEQRGFEVQRGYTGIDTAFKASWHNYDGTDKKFPHIAVISEYDALPEIGHACGHNLIAETGVAAGLAVKAAMEEAGNIYGKITVLGTPAEEGGGGKVKMIANNAFDDIDVAIMVHPTPWPCSAPTCLAVKSHMVTYRGFAVHAAVSPWEGLNALDAAVMAYNSISSLRQQIKPTDRIHAVITKGGTAANIIPDHTEMEICMRSITKQDFDVLIEKTTRCLKGAAVATGCEIEIDSSQLPYHNLRSNLPLVELYEKHMKTMDPDTVVPRDISHHGSTDMGNVSHVVPSIHPFYKIGSATNHTKEFTKVAGAPEAQGPTLIQAKVMAMIVLDVLSDDSLLQAIKTNFKDGTNDA